jgi:23S rRNA pseudouridine1911/1915/1917 synthase
LQQMPEFQVDARAAGGRLDQFLTGQLPHLSRSRVQELIKDGHVKLQGKPAKPSEKVRRGEIVAVEEPPAEPTLLEAEDIPLSILYEDKDLLVLNKPPGMVVHPAVGHARHTLVNALLAHCGSLSAVGGEQRPGIVHRLDKDTSGCLVVAKNDVAHIHLSRQFAGRTVIKIYLALVQGYFTGSKRGEIVGQIGRHPIHRKKMTMVDRDGRDSRTTWRAVQDIPGVGTVVECTLHTGRTHQIRVHMKHLGHPVLGDTLYASRAAGRYSRQMLHAWKLGFAHPRTGKWIDCCAPLTQDFVDVGVIAPKEIAR